MYICENIVDSYSSVLMQHTIVNCDYRFACSIVHTQSHGSVMKPLTHFSEKEGPFWVITNQNCPDHKK